MQEKSIIYLNGKFVPSEQALIHVSDRGFRFGDGVFETIRLVHGKPYQWILHLTRLSEGLRALQISMPAVDWNSIAQALIQHNQATDGYLRISISRGVGSRGYLPQTPQAPTLVMEYLPPASIPDKPYRLWLSQWCRVPLSALPGNAKLAQGINSTLALLEAQKHGYEEALQLAAESHLCETASANLFWVSGDTLHTPALSTGCLAGTTRAAILRLSPLPYNEVHESIDALHNADAIFITNTRLGIWPVASIEPLSLKFNPNSPIVRELQQRLAADYQSSNWDGL